MYKARIAWNNRDIGHVVGQIPRRDRQQHAPGTFFWAEAGSDSVTARHLSDRFTLKMELKLDYS